MTETKRGTWGSTRVAFLAAKDRIARRLERGEPMTAIHRELKLPMTYVQFTRLVKRHLATARVDVAPAPAAAPALPAVVHPQATAAPQPALPTEPRRAATKRFEPLTRTDPAAVKRSDLI